MTRWGVLFFVTTGMLLCACSSGSADRGGDSDGGGGGGSGGQTFLCNSIPQNYECDIGRNLSSGDVESEKTACSQEKGTAVTSCPTANLLGCCTTSLPEGETIEGCYYQGNQNMPQQQCSQLGGTWSTTM